MTRFFTRKIILVFMLMLSSLSFFASHIVGGEVIYQCLGSYNYQVTLKLYRDCNSFTGFDYPAYLGVYDVSGNLVQDIPVYYPSTTLINPPATSCYSFPPGVCVEEADYTTTINLPPLAGGYTVVYQRCCRNATIQNINNPAGTGSTYFATIPDPGTTCNNSPYFKNLPPIFLCVGSQLAVDHSATDPDGDSLYYYFCDPLDGADPIYSQPIPPAAPPYNSISWIAPYSATNPLSGSPGLTINPKTGLISGTPNMLGQWVVGVCVNEYKSGVLVGVHHRDFQFNVTNCPGLLVASVSSAQNPSCSGSSTGSATAGSTGGTAPLTYNWSNGSPFITASGLTAGTYTVTIRDAYNCSSTATVALANPAAMSGFASVNSNVSCKGGNNGSATGNGSGGAGGYTFFWNTFSSSQTISGLTAGSYTVTVTDAVGCSAISTVSITEPATGVSATASSTQSACTSNTGTATASPSGGAGGYHYLWSNGQITQTATGLAPGSYVVTVTDAIGCTFVASTNVNTAGGPTATASLSSNVSCFGATTGAATSSGSGGTGSYTYLWNNSSTSQSISGVAAGTYTVTITDANGCAAASTVAITQPASAVTASASSSSNVNCFGSATGSALSSAGGGAGGYTYLWNTTSTSSSISGLIAGTYTVTIRDANNCSAVSIVSITQPGSAVTASASASANVSCFGAGTGSALASGGGGVGGFTYVWNTTATSQTISGLTSGIYTVTIKDANNCSAVSTVSITQPGSVVTASASASANVNCFGSATGSALASGGGGVGGFTYLWNTTATSQTISGLAAGTYTVTVKDANNCTSVSTVAITEPGSAVTVSASASANVNCFGNATGSALATGGGGAGGFTYLWNTTATSQTISGLIAGTYTVTVKDANNCTSVSTVAITQPGSAVTASANAAANVSCKGGANGSATSSGSGGAGGFSYTWSNSIATQTNGGIGAGTYIVTVKDANSCTSTAQVTITEPALALVASANPTSSTCGNSNGQATAGAVGGNGGFTYLWSNTSTSSSISGLSAGPYIVTVTDSKGCTGVSTANVGNTAGPTLSVASSVNVSCFGTATGSVTTSISGGTAGYNYVWFPGGTTGASASGLSAALYTVSVTDANNCTSTVTVNITQPAGALNPSTSSTPATCGSSNGTAFAAASGGTAGYAYLWSNGATSQTITGLSAINYTVTITDAKGCTQSAVQTINNSGAATVGITASTNINCYGSGTGSVTASVSGGTPPLTYVWNNGATGVTSISGLTAGSYTLSVTDASGCLASSNVTLTEAGQLSPSISSQTNATCGNSNGQATITVSGGTAGYTYLWSNGTTSNSISGVLANPYTLTVTDALGCTASVSINISNSGAPTASVSSFTNALCNGSATGTATVVAGSGTPGYTYAWSGGAGAAATANNLPAGTYVVTVTDAVGCSTTTSVNIADPAALIIASASGSPATCGNNNGSVTISPSGGTAGYTYLWSNSSTGQNLTNLSPATYIVTLTDANGCTTSTSVAVANAGSSVVTLSAANNVTCYLGNNGSVTASTSGGTSPLTYNWSNSSTSSTGISGLTSGSYSLTVTDANGCISVSIMAITQPSTYSVSVTSATQATCGSSNGSLTVAASGGTAGYSYLWSNGITTATNGGLSAATYFVTITDAVGCTISTSASISNLGAATITFGGVTNIACNGASTGSASITTSGGTGALTYLWSNGSTTTAATNLAAGTHSVTVTDASGCVTVSNVTLTQPALITSTFVDNAASCGSNNGSAVATVSGGTGAYTYLWSNGSTGKTASGLGAGSYNLTITDGNGCTQVVTTSVSNTGTSAVTMSGATTICIGQTATLNAAVSGGVPAYTYSWSTGSTSSGAQVVSPITTTTYSLVVTDATGCSSAQQTATVTVNPALSASVSATAVTVCAGTTVILTALASGGNGNYTYSWSPGGATGSTIKIVANSSVSYTVTVNDNCGTPATNVIKPLTVNQNPTVKIKSDVTSGCGTPMCVKFTDSTSASCTSVMWNFGDGDSSAVTNPGYCYNNTGTYNVSVKCTDANGCSTKQTNAGMINVLPKPVADFSFTPTTGIKQDSIVSFTNLSIGASAVNWNFADPLSTNNSSTQNNPTHSYKDTAMYCVKLVAHEGACMDSIQHCLHVDEGCVLPTEIPNVFSPNNDGKNDIFTINSRGLTSLICTLYNRWGMLVYEYDAVLTGWDGHTFSDAAAPAGTYYYILKATCTSTKQLTGNGFVQLTR